MYKFISPLKIGSKKVGTTGGQPSGHVGGKSGGGIQVFYNIGGVTRIVTPLSLMSRKGTVVPSKSTKSGYSASLVPQMEDDTGVIAGESTKKRTEINEKAKVRSVPTRHGKRGEEIALVILSETSTQSLFFLPSLVVSTEAKDIGVTTDRNAKYLQLIEAHKNPDAYSGRSSQTVNNSQKTQNEMTVSNTLKDSGCQATNFDIVDANNQLNAMDAAEADLLGNSSANSLDRAGLTASVKKFVDNTISVSIASPGCLLDTSYVKPVESSPTKKSNKGTLKASNTSAANATSEKVEKNSDNNIANVPIEASGDAAGEPSGVGLPSQSGVGISAGVSGWAPDGSEATGEGAAGAQFTEQNIQQILLERETERIMSSELLLSRILMLERAVQQNVYHRQHLECRDLPDILPFQLLAEGERKGEALKVGGGGFGGFAASSIGIGGIPSPAGSIAEGITAESFHAEDEDLGPQKVKKLFSFFYAPLVQGRAVTAMAWNSVNTDILAVSYGRIDFKLDVNSHKLGTAVDEELSGGLVLFWSLRNPEYPEKILRTKQPVTSLDFSRFSPMLLAVGCYNGDVMVFDVKREGEDWGKPKETSANISGGHVEPVWQVKWVSRGNDRLENVVSISTDGEVLQWDLKKGLMVQTLMSLKRAGLGDGWISRQAAGLTFDFVPGDPSTYFVGAEEGGVHRCSVSYNEQYLETYEGHEGPVYRLRCSSRWPSVFLSCSSDWNIKLFHSRNKKPILTMRSSGDNEAVTDTVWCPGNSTVFASVTESGKLHIWDLSVSSIDPVVNYDTSSDIADDLPLEEAKEGEEGEGAADQDAFAALQAARKEFGGTNKDEPKESPVARLLKKLSASRKSRNTSSSSDKKKGEKKARSLTTVLFSERSPTVVVGDTNGAVTLYRVVDPVTVLLEGPLQQVSRFKKSILKAADPEDAAKLVAYDGEGGSESEHTTFG